MAGLLYGNLRAELNVSLGEVAWSAMDEDSQVALLHEEYAKRYRMDYPHIARVMLRSMLHNQYGMDEDAIDADLESQGMFPM